MCPLTEPEAMTSVEMNIPRTQILAPVLFSCCVKHGQHNLQKEEVFLAYSSTIMVGRHGGKGQAWWKEQPASPNHKHEAERAS